jgi:hypothetical protein
MDSETEIVEFREGDRPRRVPGRTTYANIVLERGYTAKRGEFEQWCNGPRRTGSIVILDRDGETEIGRYKFYEGSVVTFNTVSVDPDGRPAESFAIEKFEIAVTRIERA